MDTQTALNLAVKFVDLANKTVPISNAYLFGSTVQNTASDSSDIDVCLVSPKLGFDLIAETVRLSQMARSVDIRIEPHPMSESDFKEKYNLLAHEVKTKGIQISISAS